MTYRERYQYILTFCADGVALFLAVVLSQLVFGSWLRLIPSGYGSAGYFLFYLILALAFLVSFLCFDQTADILGRKFQHEVLRAFEMTLMIGAGAALMMVVAKVPLTDSRYLFTGVLVFNFLLQLIFMAGIKRYLKNSYLQKGLRKLVGVLTVSERDKPLLTSLKKDWTKQVCGVALMDASSDEIGNEIEGIPVKAGFDDFMGWVRREALDEVYIDVPYDTGNSLTGYLSELESMGLDVHFSVPLLEKVFGNVSNESWRNRISANLEHRGKAFLIGIGTVHHSIRRQLLKRAMDICGALVGLAISVPIIAIVAIPLKLESPGPLFFKQKRVGLNGRIFYIYKLRSMYQDAEQRKKDLMSKNEMDGLMFKMKDDPRITKVGKFIRKASIDELPQFWNVLRGDMSLVGTRPPTVDEYAHYESHHKRRLSMKPGITGMWQVSGRSSVQNFEDVVRLDTQYIDNWSFKLDLEILLKTVAVVFAQTGAG